MPRSPRVTRALDLTLVVALLAVALAWPLASPPIAAHGEAREALVVRDVVQRGRWVLPRRNGELPSKPPLYHWIAAAAVPLAGNGDIAMRMPSALAAIVTALAVFTLAGSIAGRLAAWLAVGALLGMARIWTSAAEARVDMLFTACVTVALVAFFRWYRDRGTGARLTCYLATAAAVLTKGPAGALLPALVAAAFVTRERWRGEPRAKLAGFWSWRLAALAMAIAVGWYVLAFTQGGREFLALHLLRENADRFLGRGVFGMNGGRSRFTMLIALVTDLLPWNLVLVWSAWRWMRGAREDEAGRFLHAWWIVIVGFFTIAFGKRQIYLLPLYPAIALLAGRALATTLAANTDRIFGFVRVPELMRRRFPARPALATVVLAVVVLDLGMLTVGQLAREHRARGRSLVPFAREVARHVPADADLFATAELAGSDLQVLAYRLDRTILRADDAHAACAAEASAGGAPERFYLMPAAVVRGEVVEVSHRRGADVALVHATGACATDGTPASASPTSPRTTDDDNDNDE